MGSDGGVVEWVVVMGVVMRVGVVMRGIRVVIVLREVVMMEMPW